MRSYAVWDSESGGFLTQSDTWDGAWAELDYLVKQEGCDRDYLDVIEVCPDHLDQPSGSCDECDADTEEGDTMRGKTWQ